MCSNCIPGKIKTLLKDEIFLREVPHISKGFPIVWITQLRMTKGDDRMKVTDVTMFGHKSALGKFRVSAFLGIMGLFVQREIAYCYTKVEKNLILVI